MTGGNQGWTMSYERPEVDAVVILYDEAMMTDATLMVSDDVGAVPMRSWPMMVTWAPGRTIAPCCPTPVRLASAWGLGPQEDDERAMAAYDAFAAATRRGTLAIHHGRAVGEVLFERPGASTRALPALDLAGAREALGEGLRDMSRDPRLLAELADLIEDFAGEPARRSDVDGILAASMQDNGAYHAFRTKGTTGERRIRALGLALATLGARRAHPQRRTQTQEPAQTLERYGRLRQNVDDSAI